MTRLRRFVSTLGGRIAVLLCLGTLVAVSAALFASEQFRDADYRRYYHERVAAAVATVAVELQRRPGETIAAIRRDDMMGVTLVAATPAGISGDDAVLNMVRSRVDDATNLDVRHVPVSVCQAGDPFWHRARTARFKPPTVPDCWLLIMPVGGRITTTALGMPRLPPPASTLQNPLFLLLVGGSCIGLSLLAARASTAPLRRLTAASKAFARSIDATPVAELGPIDVREALATFNLMQERVREGLRERTRLLAAISHDLQTPLTRLRLRLEQVSDEPLREQLVGDLSATLRMMRRGLELARSGESAEDWTVVDLDSLLSSLADDAAEFGQPVTVTETCGARVRVRPDALIRCLGNLIDNAVKYGGSAELSCLTSRDTVLVSIRDHGFGMTPDLLSRAFEPFVRGDTAGAAGEGSGIGLAIARAQAATIGGTLALANHPKGGLEAVLTMARARSDGLPG